MLTEATGLVCPVVRADGNACHALPVGAFYVRVNGTYSLAQRTQYMSKATLLRWLRWLSRAAAGGFVFRLGAGALFGWAPHVKATPPSAPGILLAGWGQRPVDYDIPSRMVRALNMPPKLPGFRMALPMLEANGAQRVINLWRRATGLGPTRACNPSCPHVALLVTSSI
jgi:hypothetical protein